MNFHGSVLVFGFILWLEFIALTYALLWFIDWYDHRK